MSLFVDVKTTKALYLQVTLNIYCFKHNSLLTKLLKKLDCILLKVPIVAACGYLHEQATKKLSKKIPT